MVKGDEVLLNQEKVKNYLLREKAIGVYADYFIEREKNWQKDTELLEEIKAKDTSNRPNTSIWGSVQHCNKLIPGVYSVSTAGHGGILVHKNVADLVLSYEALKSGDFENGYYHYEEDCLSSVPILEMYQKHLLQDLPWIKNPSEEKRDSLFKRNQEVIFRDCPDYAKYFYDTYGKVQEISQNKDAEIITSKEERAAIYDKASKDNLDKYSNLSLQELKNINKELKNQYEQLEPNSRRAIEIDGERWAVMQNYNRLIEKQNFIYNKLSQAGIEVVTDKEEFDRVLEREKLLQKMAESKSGKYLNTDDVKLLNDMGYKKDDFEQIQYAMLVSDIKLNGKKTSTKKTVEILGRKDFLSGIARSAFHGSSGRINGDNSVSFESYILFERNFSKLSNEKRNQLNIAQLKAKEHVESLNEIVRQESYFSFDVEDEKRYINHIDDWQKDNTNPLKMIIVGKVPPIMKVLGISEKLIEIEQSTLDKMLRDEPIYPNDKQGHKLLLDDIYAIPSQLADPVMVFKSRSRNDSYVFFTERKDLENRSILIPLAVDKKKGRLVIHEITSMYGKDNEINFVKTNIDENNLIYEDRKRSCLWANEKVEELKKRSSNGERFTQIQFLGQRFTDNGTYVFNILTKERLVNFLNGINGKNTQNFITQDGTTYGFTHERKIYLNPDIVTSEAALHEYTHLWDNYTKATNPELWNKGKEVFKNTYLWEEVKNDEHYQDISHDEDLILSECHARITGKIADQILDKIQKENGELAKDTVIDWDREVTEYCAKEFVGKDIDVKAVSEFISMTMKDFMEGRMMPQLDSYRVNHNHDYFLSEKAIEARIESAKDLIKAYFIENWEQNNKEDFIQKAIEYTLEPNSTILFDKSLKENEVEVYTKEEQEKMEQANNSIKEIIDHYSKELFETYNKSEELSSEDIKLINNFKKENNLNLLNNPTSVELVTDEIKSDEVAILFNYDIDKSKLNDLFVIDEHHNNLLSDKDNNVKLSFKVSSGSIINIDIQCYKENNIYNLSFWSDVTDTARKELCNLLKEPFKSINNNIDFTQKGWNDEWHKIHLEQAEQVNKKDNRNWILHEAPTGSLSKYINSDNVVDIDEFRDFAASKLEGNTEDKTYFKQMWILGAKFCKEKGWDLPEISLSELLDEPGEKYNKDLIEIFTDDEEFEQISNNKYVMEESEFNVVQKILTESKMDGSFDVIQLDNIDVFIDYDEDKIVSLKTGLSWLSDGLVEPTTDELSVEELSILKELLCKQNLFDKVDYINGLLEERSSEHPVSFSLRDITDEQLVELKEHLSDIPLMPKVTTVETKTQIIKENIELPFSIINNVEKGRVNIKFNQKISDKKFNSILKELKSAGWKFSSFNKQWYPDGKAVEKSETFAKELQEKFAIPEEKMTFAANTIEETESQIHNDPYGRVRFFGRNYKELDDFVTYFNRNLDKFSKNVEKIDESIAETIFESLKIERSSAINLRSLRLGLDSADNLVLLDKEKSNTQTKVISLPELLSLAKSNLEKEKNEIDLKLANFEKAENKEQCIKVFGNLLQNAKDKNTNLLSKMNLVYETYISEPKPKQLAKKISKVKPLKIGDFVGDEMVQDVFKVSNGVYQATLAKNMYKGAFAVGTYFVLDKNIVKKLNPELHQFLEDKGEFSIFETSSRITPHIIKYLIDKKLCPPRDNEYYQLLELHTEKNPLKYEVLYPITKYGFKNKLKQIYEIDKHINNDILSIGKKLLSLATEYDKKEISEWLKNDMGCEDENSLKKLFTNWVSEKEIKQQKKIDGYHSRGE